MTSENASNIPQLSTEGSVIKVAKGHWKEDHQARSFIEIDIYHHRNSSYRLQIFPISHRRI
jgi:hypothetical protein